MVSPREGGGSSRRLIWGYDGQILCIIINCPHGRFVSTIESEVVTLNMQGHLFSQPQSCRLRTPEFRIRSFCIFAIPPRKDCIEIPILSGWIAPLIGSQPQFVDEIDMTKKGHSSDLSRRLSSSQVHIPRSRSVFCTNEAHRWAVAAQVHTTNLHHVHP